MKMKSKTAYVVVDNRNRLVWEHGRLVGTKLRKHADSLILSDRGEKVVKMSLTIIEGKK